MKRNETILLLMVCFVSLSSNPTIYCTQKMKHRGTCLRDSSLTLCLTMTTIESPSCMSILIGYSCGCDHPQGSEKTNRQTAQDALCWLTGKKRRRRAVAKWCGVAPIIRKRMKPLKLAPPRVADYSRPTVASQSNKSWRNRNNKIEAFSRN